MAVIGRGATPYDWPYRERFRPIEVPKRFGSYNVELTALARTARPGDAGGLLIAARIPNLSILLPEEK